MSKNPTDPQVEPLDLQQAIDYQAGAVVSRTLLKKDHGTITLFAFDEGEGLSEHTTPFDAWVFVLDGQGQITIAGEAHKLRSGEAILMPAHRPHAVFAPQPMKMMLVMVRE
jgi:quercetin dioxygenase-like cupin family protein